MLTAARALAPVDQWLRQQSVGVPPDIARVESDDGRPDGLLVGDRLPIVSVLTSLVRRVRIALPAGQWVAYGEPTPLAGGRVIEIDVPLDRQPLFWRVE